MELIKNEEVKQTINTIMGNVMRYVTDTMGNDEWERKIATKEIIELIEKEYASKGVTHQIKLNADTYFNIPYNKNINFSNLKFNSKEFEDVKLGKTVIKKNSLITVNFPVADEYLNVYRPMSYFNKNINVYYIKEKENVWMSPTLQEYNTMKDSIDNTHGHVLTFGLGIGFYQYMALQRPEVKSVTIVEKNPKIIEIFKKFILPQFERKDDIKIIEGNAFDYCSDDFLSKFDSIFIDIHLNNEDGLYLYKEFLSKGINFDKVDFWIENQILLEVKLYLAIYLKNMYYGSISELLCKEGSLQVWYKSIHKILKNETIVIDNEKSIIDLINNKAILRKIILNTNF